MTSNKYILVCYCSRTLLAVPGLAAGVIQPGGLQRGLLSVEKQGLLPNVTVFTPNPGESGQWPTVSERQWMYMKTLGCGGGGGGGKRKNRETGGARVETPASPRLSCGGGWRGGGGGGGRRDM